MFTSALFTVQSAFVGGGIIICSPRNHKVCVRGGTSDTETTAASTNSQGELVLDPHPKLTPHLVAGLFSWDIVSGFQALLAHL
ncbi:MAG TPA: hypothetical protein VEL70_08895 [Candidatus Acidoferrum sp.]|nr:hypothetical protein [Candidatus Acidoferrum sp.]